MWSRRATPDQPAGWYPDPDGSSQLVYFDGVRWTDATVAGLPDLAAQPARSTAAPLAGPIRSPAKVLRPFYLYGGAAIGLMRLSGRVSRQQFCVFLAANAALAALAIYLPPSVGWIAVAVFIMTALLVSIPRLHDVGNSGTELIWLPALALPLIGWLQGLRLLRTLFSAGHLGTNHWGPPPI